MNVERINALADLIERQPHVTLETGKGFNMGGYTHACGTPACIAGWAAAMSLGNTDDPVLASDPSGRAEEFLGLDPAAADDLFMPNHKAWKLISPEEAAATLRHLASAGKVDWSVSP